MRFLLSKSTGGEGVCMAGWGEHRWYYVIFLLQEKTKRIFIDISFATDLKKVLRKHWRGKNPETREFFSMENPDAVPQMHVWKAGNMPRPKALVYLEKWKTVFENQGYIVHGSEKSKGRSVSLDLLTSSDKRRLKEISTDLFLQRKQIQVIRCEDVGEMRKSAHQRYGIAASDETLNIRTSSDIAYAFRQFCLRNDLTQSQGLMCLLDGKAATQGALEQDLQARLRNADGLIAEKNEIIVGLRAQLEKARSNPEYPKKYERAELQNQLLKEFIKRLPEPDQIWYEKIRKRSRRQIRAVIPEIKRYRLPNESKIIEATIEEIGYGKRFRNPLFVYAKTPEGEPVKLRWYADEVGRFGASLWSSSYLIKGSQWLFAVQETGEGSNVVGALPILNRAMMAACLGLEVEEDNSGDMDEYDIEALVKEADELAQEYDQNAETDRSQESDTDGMPAYRGEQRLDDLIREANKQKG